MVDSRVKGQRGEYLVRDLLRKHTGLQFERVPSSGALAYLKGDLYIPTAKNAFCIEVKNYEKSPFTDKIFTNKTNYIVQWWAKVCEQASAFDQAPLLFFKYSRSKIFVVTETKPRDTRYTYISWLDAYVLLAEEWLEQEEIAFEV
jgi:Holliday junction resolvase